MKRYYLLIGLALGFLLFAGSTSYALSTFTIFQGGTGTTTAPISQVLYGGTGGHYQSRATTTLTASSPLSLSNAIAVLGNAASALTLDTSGTWSGNAGTASALAGNGTNCTNQAATGVDASGNAEGCFTVSSFGFPFTPTTISGVNTNATSTIIDLTLGLYASSTSYFSAYSSVFGTTTYASTTALTVSKLFATLGGALAGGGFLINNIGAPVSGGDAANKTYVDNAIAGVNPAVAVQAATTQASDTSGFTYSNGASGVGATFTGTANTAITIDGYTFTALGQRLLVKNDTQSPSGAFNGVYYVTQVQTAILPPILTRALDYDMSSDINNTGAIPVINGTANMSTSWVITSQVTTVGTDPLTYVQFSLNPSTIFTTAGVGLSGSGNTVNLLSYLATSSAETKGQLAYFTTTSGTPAKLGVVSTSSPTFNGGLTTTGTAGAWVGGSGYGVSIASNGVTVGMLAQAANNTVLGNPTGTNPANVQAFATSSLFTGVVGQGAYFSGTGALVGTSSLFIATSGDVGVATTTPYAALSVHLQTQANNQTTAFAIGSTTNLSVNGATTTLFDVQASGLTGVGSSTPQALFSIFAASSTSNINPLILFDVGSSTSAFATTTLFSIGNTGTIKTQLGNALVLSGGANTALAAYAGGTTCSNQFVRIFSNTGAITCSTVTSAFVDSSVDTFAWPFSPTARSGVSTSATSSVIYGSIGFQASSTSYWDAYSSVFGTTTYASSTAATATNHFSTNATTSQLAVTSLLDVLHYGGHAGNVVGIATSSVTNGTGISLSAGAGALVGGSTLTITNSGVISLGNGTGINCSGTNPGSCSIAAPVSIANGGTNNTATPITSLAYFDGAKYTATSTNPLYVDALIGSSTTKNSGIGTTTPWGLFSVQSSNSIGSSAMFVVGTTSAPFANFIITNKGYVGFATSSPGFPIALATTTMTQGSFSQGFASSTAQLPSYQIQFGTTTTGEWSAPGAVWVIDLNQNITIELNATSTGALPGQNIKIQFCQDATGGRTVTWITPGQIRWGFATTTIIGTANKCQTVGGYNDYSQPATPIWRMVASTTEFSKF